MRHLEFNEKYTIWLYQAQTEEQSWDMKQLAPKWLHGGNECGYQLQTHRLCLISFAKMPYLRTSTPSLKSSSIRCHIVDLNKLNVSSSVWGNGPALLTRASIITHLSLSRSYTLGLYRWTSNSNVCLSSEACIALSSVPQPRRQISWQVDVVCRDCIAVQWIHAPFCSPFYSMPCLQAPQ